jgi:drug/metabolite transporter (DMT)-like permease
LLIGWTTRAATPESFYGAVAVVVASLLWAIGSIYGKILHLPASPLLTTGIEMLAGGVTQIFVAWAFDEFASFVPQSITARSAWAWLYLTTIGPIAFVAYAWLLRNAPIPLVATYSYVNPLVAILLGYLLGKEIITMRILLAAALIIGSVALVGAQKTR